MAGHILEPIDQFSDMNAWIFQYEDTAHIESGDGETFNQVTTVIPLFTQNVRSISKARLETVFTYSRYGTKWAFAIICRPGKLTF